MSDTNDFKPGDQEYDLLRKILSRLSSGGGGGGGGGTLSTDGTFAANSDALYPSQKAAKTFITAADAAVAAAASAALTAGLATKQNSLGFTAENSANKDVDGTLASNSDVKYPSQKATKTYADAVAATASAALTAGLATKQNSLGFTAENSANKDVDGTLASNSDVKYPSQKATKTYADAVASTAAANLTAGLATKQNSLGFTAENSANKDVDGTLAANSDVKYPSQKAVKTYADTKQAALGFTPENVANKDVDGTLAANSDTKYASQKATKTYADAVAATASAALTAGLALKQNLFSASTLTYAATTNIDFSLADYRTVTLTGNITFTSSNLAAAKAITVRIVGDASSRTLTFPAGWIFIGAAAPTALAANKTAVLSLTSFSTTDANVIAAYSVQP